MSSISDFMSGKSHSVQISFSGQDATQVWLLGCPSLRGTAC